MGKLCKQTEGKTVPFDRIQAALEAVRPVKKGELTKDEFIRVLKLTDINIFIRFRLFPSSEEKHLHQNQKHLQHQDRSKSRLIYHNQVLLLPVPQEDFPKYPGQSRINHLERN